LTLVLILPVASPMAGILQRHSNGVPSHHRRVAFQKANGERIEVTAG
jgi:hypothetical protein